jgi:hypothetical protein
MSIFVLILQVIDFWLLFFLLSTSVNIAVHILVDWIYQADQNKQKSSEIVKVYYIDRPYCSFPPHHLCTCMLGLLRIPNSIEICRCPALGSRVERPKNIFDLILIHLIYFLELEIRNSKNKFIKKSLKI